MMNDLLVLDLLEQPGGWLALVSFCAGIVSAILAILTYILKDRFTRRAAIVSILIFASALMAYINVLLGMPIVLAVVLPVSGALTGVILGLAWMSLRRGNR